MKKTIVTLVCLLVLCASMASGLRILQVRPVSADNNNPDYVEASLPLEDVPNIKEQNYLDPQTLKNVYNLPSTGGNGTIAIIDPYYEPTMADDLENFSETYHLGYVNRTFEFEQHVMAQDMINADPGWSMETSLDVEWAHAIAPNATILLVEMTHPTFQPLLDALDYIKTRSDVVAVSMSFDYPEQQGPFSYTSNGTFFPVPFSNESAYDSNFTTPNGAAFFAAAGDHGENVAWPACSPNVVGVGGTTVNFNIYGQFTSETVWNDGKGDETGGGISQHESEPLYQAIYGVQGSNGNRTVPDVSFDAGTPVTLCDSFVNSTDPYYNGAEGTSIGAPCWAAIYSLRPTASNPILYALGKSVYNSPCFRDINSGGNGNYSAEPGYDFCTGLGSPLTGAFNSSLPGDLSLIGKVDVYSASILGAAFDSVRGDSNWNPLADINNDGTVDIYDAIIMSDYYGNSYTAGSDSMSGNSGAQPMQSGGTSVTVDPSSTTVFKGEVFSVNVDVTSVTNLQGWEFQLYWNSTVLNCTNVAIQTPSQWQGNTLNFGPGLQANYNATTAQYWQAQVATYPASTFNGSMTLATLTFQAMQPGSTSLTLADTKLSDSSGDVINCSVSSGSVTVYYGRYMRSDTQTINGLGAYKLNIPESTSSASATQSGDGQGASWGIRAFVRHSNGVEQEISLDGQTGTPKAVVYRTTGSGLQSNTVTVAQTALQQTDSLVIRVYAKVGTSDWTASATFTTEQLQASTLKATTWTLYYYTYAYYYRTYNFTASTFYWGTTTYNSQIQNLQYT